MDETHKLHTKKHTNSTILFLQNNKNNYKRRETNCNSKTHINAQLELQYNPSGTHIVEHMHSKS